MERYIGLEIITRIGEDTMQKLFLVSIILMMTAGFAAAEMYKWVDDKGTVNFTEDYSKIPKKYRKKVKVK